MESPANLMSAPAAPVIHYGPLEAQDPAFPPLDRSSQASVAGGARKRAARGGGDRDPRPSSPAQEGSPSADENPSSIARSQARAMKRASRAIKKEESAAEVELHPFIVPKSEADASADADVFWANAQLGAALQR